MTSDPKRATLSNPLNQNVFKAVVKARHLILKDLFGSLESSTPKDDVVQSLNQLEKVGLIKAESSSIPEFSTYYVTAEGLQADRQLRRLGDVA
jgi:hypothetical protein